MEGGEAILRVLIGRLVEGDKRTGVGVRGERRDVRAGTTRPVEIKKRQLFHPQLSSSSRRCCCCRGQGAE